MSDTIEFADLTQLNAEARACNLCYHKLPLGPKPIFQTHIRAKILIAGQAPGRLAHASGIPFMDKSGDRLRKWMGISEAVFYNPHNIAIVPLGFCYPGKVKSGDAAPIPECAEKWQAPFKAHLPNIKLTLLIGLYAQRWHLGKTRKPTLTQTVMNWREYYLEDRTKERSTKDRGTLLIPLPHPSPRNNIWMAKNQWFERELLPELKTIIADILE